MDKTYDSANVFARILRGEVPCTRVYEDGYALAFPDIAPRAPAHILVIPKGPYTDVADFSARATAAEIEGFWRAVAKVAQEQGLDAFRLIANTGAAAGQEVGHFHVHLLAGRPLGPMVSGAL
ncbi:MAG TPA: histidine triad nucleotide-binding protein [Rhodospirillaceae bacterium]|jgi:histidine triad (HIT) family protein|nr:HIT domain-containing protein [Alphaproteobacteria bacterium]HBH26628.1 histidine triad nucleotide-binding protein [Rhodospirillaceae bacterium]